MRFIISFLKSPRTWGLVGTAVVLYFLTFVVFGKLDMSWIMPDTNRLARRLIDNWQNLPFFAVKKDADEPGKEHYIYYTVPTKQFSAKELAEMGVTNAVAHPAPPR